MKKAWLEMRLKVPADGVDLVCSELADLGCEGITVEERHLDTFIPPDPDEPLPENPIIRAYFPTALQDAGPLLQEVAERLAWLAPLVPGLASVRPEIVPVNDEDWAENWKQHFPSFRVGRRLIVKPTWEDFAAGPGEVELNLDPGMAFGTGTHATTRLCLEAMVELFEGPSPPRRVLDVGTGSGILAIAAALLGCSRVLACDIDPDACRIAAENAARNGVGAAIEVTTDPLENLDQGFDVVLANILAEENIRLAPELVRRLSPGGVLILSGILLEKEELVAQAFSAYPLQGPRLSHRDEWTCLVYRKDA